MKPPSRIGRKGCAGTHFPLSFQHFCPGELSGLWYTRITRAGGVQCTYPALMFSVVPISTLRPLGSWRSNVELAVGFHTRMKEQGSEKLFKQQPCLL